MNSRSVFVGGFIALFFVSLFLFYFYLRPDKFSLSALFQSVVITLPAIFYLLIRNNRKSNTADTIGIYTSLSPIVSAVVFAVVAVSLLSIDIDSLEITRNTAREENIFIRLINLHIVLMLFVCIYTFAKAKKYNKPPNYFLITLAFALSFSIALLEGRRTSILIPIILIGLFSVTSSSNTKDTIKKSLLFLFLFIFLFVLITAIRSPNITQLDFLFRAILSRLFNPGHMILEVFTQNDLAFKTGTIEKIIERMGYISGLNGYDSNTNEFGIYYGFLSPSNKVVGINPGVVTELFLAYGWFFYVPLFLLFEFSFLVMKLYERILFKSDLFVAVLIVHGMQMEVPYTIGVLVKLFVVGVIIYGLSWLLPKRKVCDKN